MGAALHQPIYVDDLAEAVVAALAPPATSRQAYNLGGAEPIAFVDLVRQASAALGRQLPLVHIPPAAALAAARLVRAGPVSPNSFAACPRTRRSTRRLPSAPSASRRALRARASGSRPPRSASLRARWQSTTSPALDCAAHHDEHAVSLLLSALVALGVSAVVAEGFRRWALRRRLLDVPNARSSHTSPRPRGGGVGIVVGFMAGLAVWLASGGTLSPRALGGLLGALLIAGVSFADDLHSLPAVAAADGPRARGGDPDRGRRPGRLGLAAADRAAGAGLDHARDQRLQLHGRDRRPGSHPGGDRWPRLRRRRRHRRQRADPGGRPGAGRCVGRLSGAQPAARAAVHGRRRQHLPRLRLRRPGPAREPRRGRPAPPDRLRDRGAGALPVRRGRDPGATHRPARALVRAAPLALLPAAGAARAQPSAGDRPVRQSGAGRRGRGAGRRCWSSRRCGSCWCSCSPICRCWAWRSGVWRLERAHRPAVPYVSHPS